MNVSSTPSASVLQSAAASAAQEAAETLSQTRTEAAKGDQQAVRRLARTQAQNVQPKAAPAPETSAPTETSGKVLNVKV